MTSLAEEDWYMPLESYQHLFNPVSCCNTLHLTTYTVDQREILLFNNHVTNSNLTSPYTSLFME